MINDDSEVVHLSFNNSFHQGFDRKLILSNKVKPCTTGPISNSGRKSFAAFL